MRLAIHTQHGRFAEYERGFVECEDRSKYGGGPERNGRTNSDGAPPRHESFPGSRWKAGSPLDVECVVDGGVGCEARRRLIVLARAITLIESSLPDQQEMARELVTRVLPHAGRSIRIGLTGAPGVGKSALIKS